MTITYTKDKVDYKINDEKSEELKDKICTMYDDFYSDLAPHIADYKIIKEHIYGILRNTDKKNYLMSKIYEQAETYQAQLINRCANSVESLFGVEGNNKTDNENSNVMKAFIEEKLEKMEFLSEYPDGIKNYIEKGGFYTFTTWVTTIKEVKRVTNVDIQTGEEATHDSKPENIELRRITKQITVYDGAKSISIDPYSIVFDKNQVGEWDKCPKIYKTWLSPEEILSTKDYKISKDTEDKLKEIAKTTPDSSNKDDTDIATEAINGNMVEVLEYWGDIRLTDGTYLENWHAVVVGRLEVVRFCKNPFLINPITRCVFKVHPDTKREISPLLIACVLNAKKSEIFRKVLSGLNFATNPCVFTNGDVGIKGDVEVAPGKVIALKNELLEGNPIALTIDGKGIPFNLEVMPQFDNDIEAATGINKYLTGDAEGAKVNFAAEANGVMNGGQVRINKDVNNINYHLTKATIQKIADLNANMIANPVEIKIRNNGKIDFKEVTPDILQGDYEFKVSDSNQMALDKQKAQQTIPILEQIAKEDPDANVRAIEEYALQNVCGIKDTAQFFNDDDPLQKVIGQLPEEQREQVKQRCVQFIQNPQSMIPQQPPTPNKIVADGFAKTICDDNRYTDEFKSLALQILALQPTQEFLQKQQGQTNANTPTSQPITADSQPMVQQ